MTLNTQLKLVMAAYFFVLGFVVFYGIDIIVQHLIDKQVDWTKYIGNAFTHALMFATGAFHGWDACKDYHER